MMHEKKKERKKERGINRGGVWRWCGGDGP
jgi:hypothetical protein